MVAAILLVGRNGAEDLPFLQNVFDGEEILRRDRRLPVVDGRL